MTDSKSDPKDIDKKTDTDLTDEIGGGDDDVFTKEEFFDALHKATRDFKDIDKDKKKSN